MIASIHRAFQGQHGKHVLLDLIAELTQFFQAHLGQILTRVDAVFHRVANDFMAVAERQATAHQIIRQVGRGGETAQCRFTHDRVFRLDRRDHVGKRAQRIAQGVGGVEQRLLVFLIVLVVGQWLAFHQGQQAHQRAEHTAGLAAHQFGHIGVFLLRHDRAAGAETVRQIDELELRAGPQHQLFGETRQVHHRDARGRAEFDGEVAIGNVVQRVAADGVEAEQLRGVFAVDRVGRAGQRGAAQRHAVGALAAVDQTLVVAAEHFEPGQHVMPESHWLCGLQVGEAGHDARRFTFGLLQQAFLQAGDLGEDQVDFIAQPQADIGGDLVVAAAPGVELFTGDADAVGQACFDVHVHVFEVDAPVELAGLDFALNGLQAIDDAVALGIGQHADLGQHGGVGDRAHDVVAIQALVESDGGGEAGDEGVDGFTEAAAPGLIGLVSAHEFARIGLKKWRETLARIITGLPILSLTPVDTFFRGCVRHVRRGLQGIYKRIFFD